MASTFSFGNLSFNLTPGEASSRKRREAEDPFNMAIWGDFSGRTNRGISEPVAGRTVRRIDLDNAEEVLAKFGAELKLPLAGRSSGEVILRFEKLDDFHPENLISRIPLAAKLVEKRKLLLNPATAAVAERELRSLFDVPAAATAGDDTPASAPAESDDDTLGRLLGGSSQKPAGSAGITAIKGSAVDKLIKGIVAASTVPSASAQQSAILSVLDLELAGILRAVLHHRDFQTLEAAWRGLDLLVRGFGGEENLKLFVVDLSKEELTKDLTGSADLGTSGFAKIMLRQPEDRRFTLCLGQYSFDDQVTDLETLGRLARVTAQARAPFLAGARPQLAGCETFQDQPYPDDWTRTMQPESQAGWEALRKLPEAGFIGLGLPRFLLRQPYGKGSDPIEAFPFEELETYFL